MRALILASIVLATAADAFAGEANLDPSFGTFGVAITNPGTGDDGALAVALQPDGSVVAAGHAAAGLRLHFGLVRYNAGGVLDTAFGNSGLARVEFSPNALVRNVLVQPDGRIVAVGDTFFADAQLALARLNADGTLDASFGSGGRVTTNVTPSHDSAAGAVIQPDGKIVVAASVRASADAPAFAVLRYLSNGSLDPTFGTDGIVITAAGTFDVANDLLLQPDGKLVVVGFTSGPPTLHAVLARYHADGALDATFGSGGIVHTSLPDGFEYATAAVLEPGGSIVVVAGSDDFAVARFASDGSADATFGTGGVVRVDLGGLLDIPTAIVRRPDGRLVVGGEVVRSFDPDPDIDLGLVTLLPDGSLDASFGTGGRLALSLGPGTDTLLALALQPDGRLVATGGTSDDGGADLRFLALRFGSDCGNDALDAGEECDDGNAAPNDCCSPGCAYEAAETGCDLDADLCTADRCDGSGTCRAGEPLVCSVCETCDVASGCVAAPPATSCTGPSAGGGSKLALHRTRDGRTNLSWNHNGSATLAALGDPLGDDDYGLCVYGAVGQLLVGASAPAGGTCGATPCWKPIAQKGYLYRDSERTPDGVQKLRIVVKPSGASTTALRGKGVRFAFPTFYGLGQLPFPLRAQLRAKNGLCLEASYPLEQARTKQNTVAARAP